MIRRAFKKQLLVPMGLAFLLLVFTILACIHWLHLRQVHREVDTRLAGVDQAFPDLLRSEANSLQSQLDLLIQNRELRQAYLASNRKQLLDLSLPVFEQMRRRFGVTHFYFIGPDQHTFLRVHEPQRHGDFLERFTLEEAVQSGQPSAGIELGTFGTFTLRAVQPLSHNGRILGYLELGKQIDHLPPTLARTLGVELVFTIAKEFLSGSEWQEGKKIFGSPRAWNELADRVIADTTFDRIPPAVKTVLRHQAGQERISLETESGRNYEGGFLPLFDAGARQVGTILVLYDTTEQIAHLNKVSFLLALFSLSVGGCLLLLYNFHASRLTGRLNNSFEALEHEIGERQQAQAKLQSYKARLEKMVEERTAELAQANTSLQQDILCRKQTEKALRESEEKFRHLFDSANDGILIIDPEEMHLLESNRTIHQQLGYQAGELNHGVGDLFPDQEIEKIKEMIRITMSKGYTVFESLLQKQDGLEFPVEISNRRFEFNGCSAVLSLVRDITDRKRTERELQRAQRIDSIGVLAGGIAHDFNNILMATLGNVTLAKLYVDPANQAMRKLEQAEQSILRARDISQQLLTFAKGGTPLKKPAAVAPLLKEPVNFALLGSNVVPEYFLPADLWLVEVDKGQFEQVINNLTLNAVQAMTEGGTIKISAANVMRSRKDHQGGPAGRCVQIRIIDQGPGIPPDILPKIFDPFFTTKERGCGLGLATSYSIITNHGGTLNVSSKKYKGSTFTILLPASGREVPLQEEEPEGLHQGSGRILVMDDDPAVSEVAAGLLNVLGYEACLVREGGQALAAYQEAFAAGRPYKAVITDLTVPGGMGGLETVRKLLKIDPAARVIVSSGYANNAVMANYADYGFKGVARKPYRLAELSITLEEVFRDLKSHHTS